MDMHTRAIEAFKRSEFHTRNGHRKPGMYDSAGLGSRERQGRPFVLPDDKAPPIRSESIASSTSFDSAYSDRYTRMGNGSEQHRPQQSGEPFVSTGTDLTWGSTSSTDMSPRVRQRQDSSNSNGHVKFAPDNAAFENLRSEAMELWHNGVDLELKQTRHQSPKKKAEWMSESEFQNYQGSADHKATSTAAATTTAAPPSTNGRTFAQVVNPTNNANVNSIGWSPEEEQSIPTNTMLHQYHLPQQQSFNHQQHQQQHSSSLHYLMSPPRIQRQGAETETVVSPIQVTPSPQQPPPMPLAVDHVGDAKMYRRLFFMSTSLYKPESTRRPYEDIEDLLLKCRQLGEKNFGMMVHMLLSRFKQERSQGIMQSKLPIATIMRKNWITFYAALNDYIHFSVLTPHELLPLLALISQFASACPGYEGIPLSTLQKRYQEIKGVFEHQHMQRSETLLREIERDMKAKPDLRLGDYDHWQSNRENGVWKKTPDHSKLPIPPIPDTELLLQETRVMLEIENKTKISATSPLRQYFRDHRLDRITNILDAPYPNEETYLTVHYVLLRDEIFGPLYEAIRQYAIERSATDPIAKFGCGWTMHTHCKSVCSALLPTINEPAIVFENDFPCPQSSLPLEGSMAMLIPSGSGLLSWDSLLDTAVKGTIVCAYVNPRGVSMMAIHIDREQVEKINWSANYTVLTSNTNSMAMLPVLEWLQSQCTHINDRNLSKVVTPLLLSPSGASGSTTPSLTNETPDYLCGVALNISSILVPKLRAKGFKAQIGASEGTSTWPEHSKAQLALHPSQREPLYSLSSSQLKATQYALTHQVAMITGTEGTGKTFLASKLIELTYQALISSQCFQPILVLTRRESTLDDILDRLVNTIPDLLRLGATPAHEPLLMRQAIRVAEPNVGDPDRKYHHMLERKIATWQGHLTALWKYRNRIEQADPSVMVTTLPPYCKQAMIRSCMNAIVKPFTDFTMEQLWDLWMEEDDKDTAASFTGKHQRHASEPVDRGLTQAVFATSGKRAQPIVERKWFNERRQFIEKHTPEIASLADASNWPLPTSSSSYETRKKMVRIWNAVEPQQLWNLPRNTKYQLRNNVIDTLLEVIDTNIDMILQEQMKAAKILEDARQKKWVSSCRFSRVVGMTAECAAQNTELVSSLWPRVVIVDEAHEILESTMLPFVLGSRAEHVIMIGDHQSTMPPPVHNPALRNDPKHLDTSMFERWKRSGGTMIRLEEQWRMCKEIAGIHDSVAMTATTAPDRSLLITAPIASENCVDESSIELFGVSQRAFFINHAINPQGESTTHGFFSRMSGIEVTEQDVEEARYACHLGLYLFQQGYKPSQITILTLSPIMNKLIKSVMHEHIRTVSVFAKPAVDGIHVHSVDDYIGKENMFVILVLRMPDEQVIPEDNISLALSRARHGLYIVGNVSYLGKGIWANVAQQMRARGSLDSHLTVTCKSHPDTTNHLGHHRDFEAVRNGGCNRVCNTLLECGHACEEMCHHLKHSSATSKCKRPCVRPRSCEHKCPNACYECENQPCPPCTETTTKTLKCGHTATGQCSEIIVDKFECQEMIDTELPCGHSYVAKCHLTPDEDKIKCEEVVDMVLDCGHQVSAPCGYKPICTQVCRERLECGHPCSKPCGSEQHSHSRDLCTASCPKQLICGHNCAKGCASAEEHTERCLEPCRHVCSHGYKCGRDCWEVCNLCMNPCPYMCEHKRCTKKCYERCDRLPCEEACSKILDCSHPCPGLCGEPCPPCKECHPDLKCSISLRTLSEFEKNEKVYMLPECGCVFAAESLDLYFNNQAKNGEHTAIKLWQCPSCQKPIYTALRYNIYIKTEIALVNQIKRQQEEIRQRISQREKQDIIEAMNAETKMSVHNIVGGRWFVCENGHPYYIGECGGATEISNCPHCGAVIGGLQHKVVDSNRFYGEFDGSFQPAWPGQPS
ncbi:nfx1-type zinc finger-containing protein 1 [Lichtheimia corymbifera JMRC:FSU:9682]|uniref:Nfx1-type zinc finger-containing protein 1 n=1 Tax=Lichtheimia corymbifera JMRC:FSU:9682 TaxID=1263082 RepID=A0A068RJ92_9FUNG|nr:nfx1-type zinc finger-containing protein 1 [Lichtheimia corymbifera JMRC:FSU:9682]